MVGLFRTIIFIAKTILKMVGLCILLIALASIVYSSELPASLNVSFNYISIDDARQIFKGNKRLLKGQLIKVYIPNLHSEKARELIEKVLLVDYNQFLDAYISNQAVLFGAVPVIVYSDSAMEQYLSSSQIPAIGFLKKSIIFVIVENNKNIKLLSVH